MTAELVERIGTEHGTSADLTYRRLFGLHGFGRLAAGTLLARTGGMLWEVSLVLFVLRRFQSPTLAGVAAFVAIVPGLLLAPLAGALLDRHGRLRLIRLDYAVAAVALTALALCSLLDALSPPLLLLIITCSSLTGPLSASGTRSLFPLVVPRSLWDRANAVDSGTQALAAVTGPALAGLLVAWIGGEGAFFVAAGVFVAAGLVIRGVRVPADESPQQTEVEPLLRASRRALTFVVRHPTLRGLVFTLWLTNVPMGIVTVALPVLVLRSLHWGADAVGGLWSVAGVATVLAGAIFGRINSEGRERQLMVAGMALSALGMVALVIESPVALVVGMALIGFSFGPANQGMFALRQRRTDPAWFGRVLAISMSLNFAGQPIGSALGGPLVEHSTVLALVVAAVIAVLGCAAPLLLIPRDE